MTRPAEKILADLLQLERDAAKDPQSIPIREALEGRHEARWDALIREARALLAEQPS